MGCNASKISHEPLVKISVLGYSSDMTTVLATGVFDHFHPGHRFFLESAKKLGDRLVVIVARDENVFRIKGFFPEYSEKERLQSIRNSGVADEVLLGKRGEDFLKIVSEIAPDLLAVGYDQHIPPHFSECFPQILFCTIPAKNPEKWKSSFYRKST